MPRRDGDKNRRRNDDNRRPGNRKKGSRSNNTRAQTRVAGAASVTALFDVAPDRIERLFFTEKLEEVARPFCAMMSKARRPWRRVDSEELARIAGTAMHGGIVAVAQDRTVPVLEAGDIPALARDWARDGGPVLILDGVGNPHNLGAIARTAAFFGVRRLILSDHPAQAGLSDASYRVAEGGLEYMDIYRARRLETVLTALKPFFCTVATAPDTREALPALRRGERPFALVLGNEEDGLPAATLKACEKTVAIPGGGDIQSLNVSASAAIFLYALFTQN
jgi:TrmH RNA methyltransferase